MQKFWNWLRLRGESVFTPLHVFIGIVILVFVLLVIRGCVRQYEDRRTMLEDCVPTQFYVIDSRDHLLKVYDCSSD